MHRRSVPSAAPSADKISDRLDDGSADTSRSARPCSRVSWRRAEASTCWPESSAATSSGWGSSGRRSADDPALSEHHDAVRQPEHLVDVVAGKQDRGALLAQAHDQLFDLRRLHHAQRRRRLVQRQQPRADVPSPAPRRRAGAGRRTAGARCAWCRAAGCAATRAGTRRSRGNGCRRASAAAVSWPSRMLAATSRLSHSARSCQTTAMPCRPPPPGRAAPACPRVDLTAGRGDVAGDAADQGGLPGAVLAGQRDQLALCDAQVDAVQSADRAVADAQAGHREQRLAALLGSARRALVSSPRRALAGAVLIGTGRDKRATHSVIVWPESCAGHNVR